MFSLVLQFMKCHVLTCDPKEITVEARNLLSVAYKNVVGARRSAWRIVSSVLTKKGEDDPMLQTCKNYMAKIEEELEKICKEVVVSL